MEKTLTELIARCRSETERYALERVSDTQPCWEIWRRAVVEQNGEAWEALLEQYAQIVRRWLRKRLSALPWLQQDEDFLLNATFTKFYRYVDSDKFQKFPSLAALLRYLQMCSMTVIVDEQRDYQARRGDVSLETNLGDGDDTNDNDANLSPLARLSSEIDVAQEVLDKTDRQNFWQQVKQVVTDDVDLLLLYLDFVQGMPPRQVAQIYPRQFPDVKEVYRRRKNLLWRMRNNAALFQQLL